MEYTPENLAAVEEKFKIRDGTKKQWKNRGTIPARYFSEKKNFVEKKSLLKIKEILNFPEIRSGRLKTTAKNSWITLMKQGRSDRLRKQYYDELKISINEISAKLVNFSEIPVKLDEKYFEKVLDISEIPALNWREIVRKIDGEKPHYAQLKWSYYHKTKPSAAIVINNEAFFEKLRLEIKLISVKIKS